MTDSGDNSGSGTRLAGNWQMPVFIVGLFGCMLAGATLVAKAPRTTWEQRYQDVADAVVSVEDGDYGPVDEAAKRLLARSITPEDEPEKLAKVYLLLADIRWRSIQFWKDDSPEQLKALRDYLLMARQLGADATAETARQLGWAKEQLAGYELLSEARTAAYASAVEQYELAMRFDPGLRAALERRIIELGRDHLHLSRDDVIDRLIAYMSSPDIAAEDYGWAISEAVGLLIEANRPDAAESLVLAEQRRVDRKDFQDHLMYQRARILASMGLARQAEDVLVQLLPRLEGSSDLAVRGHLLKGRLIWRENPNDAVMDFRDVIDRAPSSPLATAARVGLAMAYGRMELHEESVEQYEQAAEELSHAPRNEYVDIPLVCRALADAQDVLLKAGRADAALRFVNTERKLMELQGDSVTENDRLILLERLAGTHMALAEQLAKDLNQARASLKSQADLARLRGARIDELKAAGEVFLEAADLAEKNYDSIHGDSLWMAAEVFDAAGLSHRTIDVLREFVLSRPSDPRLTEARHKLAEALRAAGRFDEAIEVYRENLVASEPQGRNLQAAQGLIPMALCYIAKGPEFYPQAEEILNSVTDGSGLVGVEDQPVITDPEMLTPESGLYRDALFALGRLFHRQERWDASIAKLTEAVQRDPGKLVPLGESDPLGDRKRYIRATRSMFLMADSYQRLALEAMKEASKEKKLQRRKALMRRGAEQLEKAESLFAQVSERFEALGGKLDEVDEAYRRNSYFARGDCMFELGRYDWALRRYEQAVNLFVRHPAALGGLMQMYNCYVALGELEEARATLRQARVLQENMDYQDHDGALDTTPGLESWNQWLDTMEFLDPLVTAKGDDR